MDSSMLEGSQANYICGIYLDEESAGVCFCDVTTGRTHATAFSGAGGALLRGPGAVPAGQGEIQLLAGQDGVLVEHLVEVPQPEDVTTGRTHATAFSGAERLEHVVNPQMATL